VFEAFEASYRRCDADLCALEVRKSGTTAVSVLIRKEGKNRVLYVANVGDSRATLCNKGKGERLSYDHKASDPAENKRVTDLGATVLWDKVQGQLSVTRALGDHDLKQYVSCEPHFATMTLAKEHKFLVVACDGIWDVTDDQTGGRRAREGRQGAGRQGEAADRVCHREGHNRQLDGGVY
jgi:protein phosphatase PTC1